MGSEVCSNYEIHTKSALTLLDMNKDHLNIDLSKSCDIVVTTTQ